MKPINAALVTQCIKLAGTAYGYRPLPCPLIPLREFGGTNTIAEPRFIAASHGPDLSISVRGLMEPSDVATGLDISLVPIFGDRLIHEGSLAAARWMIDLCRDLISHCTGRVVLCGHSLGGSIPCAAATVLQLEEHNPNAFAVCFGTFPTVCKRLSLQVRPFVTTFIFNGDSVPRMTPQNVKMMVAAAGGDEAGLTPVVDHFV
jgi:hypothetical protein